MHHMEPGFKTITITFNNHLKCILTFAVFFLDLNHKMTLNINREDQSNEGIVQTLNLLFG